MVYGMILPRTNGVGFSAEGYPLMISSFPIYVETVAKMFLASCKRYMSLNINRPPVTRSRYNEHTIDTFEVTKQGNDKKM